MDRNSLSERLARLHAELQNAHEEHPATRPALGAVLPDIKQLLDRPAAASTPASPSAAAAAGAPASSAGSLPGRLEQLAVQFEADHPKLAASARSLIDLLGETGI
jgi:hypothetical protein